MLWNILLSIKYFNLIGTLKFFHLPNIYSYFLYLDNIVIENCWLCTVGDT